MIKQISLCILIIIAIGGACFAQAARPERPEKIQFPEQTFHPPKPDRAQLPNGLTAYLLSDKSVPLIRVRVLIHAGSLCETSPEAGLAGLTASMLRLGGSTLTSATEINQSLEYAGGSLESSGSRDYAFVSLLALSEDKEMGLRFLSEILRNPAFPEDKIEQTKIEFIEALRRQDDDPAEISRREFRKVLFGDHPYGRDPKGSRETLAKFQRKDLVDWHRKWYQPERMIFAIAGDFDNEEMLELLNRFFGDMPRSDLEFAYPAVRETAAKGQCYFIAKDLNQSTVRIGHLGIAQNSPDRMPLELLNFILGSGSFSSRLFQKVRNEEGLAYSVASDFEESLLRGQFLAFLQTQTDRTVHAVELTRQIIAEMAEGSNITEKELQLAKQSKMNEYVFLFETPIDVAYLSAETEYFGLPTDYYDTYREKMSAITLSDIQRAAKKYLLPLEQTLMILGNPSLKEELKKLGSFRDIEIEKE